LCAGAAAARTSCAMTCALELELLVHMSAMVHTEEPTNRRVMLAANQMIGELRGRRVRICMDSYPAIRNFINGGGSKQDLNALVKEWWVWCRMNRITPLYKWIPREENTLADELSKIAAGQDRRAVTLCGVSAVAEYECWSVSIA
jgi:hypothetical protein